MHSCPSCKKSTSNMLLLDDGWVQDVCDTCTVVALAAGTASDMEAMFLESISEMVTIEAQVLA